MDVGGTKWRVVRDDHRERDTAAAVPMSVAGSWLVTLDVKHPDYVTKMTRRKLTKEALKYLSSPVGLPGVVDLAPAVQGLAGMEPVR